MADFRKCIPVLAVLALILGMTATASAQIAISPFSCTATAAVPPLLRAEGITEMVGDIVLDCTGGQPTTASGFVVGGGQVSTGIVPQVNVQVFFNTAVTSRLLAASSTWSEALLLVDEPGTSANPSPQLACGAGTAAAVGGVCSINAANQPATAGSSQASTSPGFGTYNGSLGRPNVFQGQVVGNNSVQWLGVPIDAPGTNGHRIIRITNVRVNASALATFSGPIGGVSGPSATPVPVFAVISLTGPTSVPINNPTQTVGFVQRGLVFSVRNAASADVVGGNGFAQCISTTRTRIATLRYQEGFATAFKARFAGDVLTTGSASFPGQYLPGAIYNTESGFYNPNLANANGIATAGLADFGTRVRAVFNNIPAGVSIGVDWQSSGGSTVYGRLVTSEAGSTTFGTTSSDTFGCTTGQLAVGSTGVIGPVATCSATVVGLTAGTAGTQSGVAVWELFPLAANAQQIDRAEFGVYITYSAAPGGTPAAPGLGTGTISGSFAPISTVTTASTTAPVPRFADPFASAMNLFGVNGCVTNILFPYVVNAAGFDTGIAISNTSTDIFGTVPQAGGCAMYPFGTGGPWQSVPLVAGTGTGTTATFGANVATGATSTMLVSGTWAGFSGYVIARCNFQFAHGLAFISDVGTRNFAMGYLGLIIPDLTSRSPQPFPLAGSNTGEQLGY